MAYYTNLFSPETYEAFTRSDQTISGFRTRQKNAARRIKPGDKLVCYITKISRWAGILEVTSEFFENNDPLFLPDDDPFVVRFRVRPLVWLPIEKAVPIKEDIVWTALSFTKGHKRGSNRWTGKMRNSLNPISDQDGRFLEELLKGQNDRGLRYELDEGDYRKHLKDKKRVEEKAVNMYQPPKVDSEAESVNDKNIRESYKIQAHLARIGDEMGLKIWLPQRDRSNISQLWSPTRDGVLLPKLPQFHVDPAFLKTVGQIDVLWFEQNAILRAFEVEHTTAIYSGILRMADLLALQPNINIKLHIVAPYARMEKVFQEIQRPAFSMRGHPKLSDICSFISYDSVRELARERNLSFLKHSVIEKYVKKAG